MTQISRWDYTIGHNHDKFQEWYAEVIYSRPVGKNHDNLDNWKRLVAKYGKDWEYYDRDLFFGYKWNSMGHRNDYEFNSWGNKPWMLALGDSNVEGTGNRRIDLFHEVIAKEKGLVNYNAGIGGTSNHAAMWNGLTLLNLAETKPEFVLIRLTDSKRYSFLHSLAESAYESPAYKYKLKDVNTKGTMSYETDVSTTRDIKNVRYGGLMFHQGPWTDRSPWVDLYLDRDEHKVDKSETRIMFLMLQQYCYINNIQLVLLTATGQSARDNWEKFAQIPGTIEVEEIRVEDGEWHTIPKARDDMHFGASHHFKIAQRVLEAI